MIYHGSQKKAKTVSLLILRSGGVIIVLISVIFLISCQITLTFDKSNQTPINSVVRTPTPERDLLIFEETAHTLIEQYVTNISSSTQTPTQISTLAFGIGSTMTRENDGMEMLYVPEGVFIMGVKENDPDAGIQNLPESEAFLNAYWIDKYEVTNAQYKMCVENGPCTKPQETFSHTRSSYYSNPVYDNYPVIYINWHQANQYCEWIGGSLPTEPQWEKAARGPNGNKYPWGDQIPNCSMTNFDNCIEDTTAVGSYPEDKSFYFIMDMAGNVTEITKDWYMPYGIDTSNDIFGGRDAMAVRGGVWINYYGSVLTSASRGLSDRESAEPTMGFRCVIPVQ